MEKTGNMGQDTPCCRCGCRGTTVVVDGSPLCAKHASEGDNSVAFSQSETEKQASAHKE